MAVTGDSHEQSPSVFGTKILVRPGKKNHVPADVTGAYDAGRYGKNSIAVGLMTSGRKKPSHH